MSYKCEACKDTGEYRGLNTVEPCRECCCASSVHNEIAETTKQMHDAVQSAVSQYSSQVIEKLDREILLGDDNKPSDKPITLHLKSNENTEVHLERGKFGSAGSWYNPWPWIRYEPEPFATAIIKHIGYLPNEAGLFQRAVELQEKVKLIMYDSMGSTACVASAIVKSCNLYPHDMSEETMMADITCSVEC